MRCASLLGFLVAAAPLALVACGLDASGLDRVTEPYDASPSGTTTAPPPADASSVAPFDARSPPPAADGALPPPTDAASAPDAPTSAGCDQDSDGHAARGGCGGDDCCDTDARAHPGETTYYGAEDACSSFDYDCNDHDDEEFGQASCQLDFFGGSCGGDGFAAPTACGATGTYTTCNYAVFSCNTAGLSRVQGCR